MAIESGGNWTAKTPKITPELAAQVGELHGKGYKLSHALAMLNPPIPLEHWKRAFMGGEEATSLFRAYERKVAEGVGLLLEQINPSNKGWQACAWVLERVHGYTTQREQVQVNVTHVLGVADDVVKRARRIAEKRQRRANVIDVSSTPAASKPTS